MKKVLTMAGLIVAAASALSCGSDDAAGDDAALVGEAADSMDMVQNEGALLSVATEGASTQATTVVLPLPATPEDAAAKAAERMKARLQPEGCVTIEVSGATLTATLNECTGRLGLRHVTGTLSVTFSVDADGVHADASGTGLKVNRATMDVTSTLVRSLSGSTVTTKVTTKGTGTGPRGKAITRDGQYTVTYDMETECRTLDGDWKTTVGDKEYTTTVTAFTRCLYDCPSEGGKIVHTNSAKDRTITITFDGSAQATWESTTGKSGTEKLYCGAAEQ